MRLTRLLTFLNKAVKFILVFIFLQSISLPARAEINAKKIKRNSIDSMVKVVASYNKNEYVMTGIALERNYILTSRKILNFPYRRLNIVTAIGEKYPAKIIGEDISNSLLLLKIKNNVLKPFKFAKKVETGEKVVLLGGFYEEFPAVFMGIISMIGSRGLVIDSSLVPGAIGGAVLNHRGELLGILRGKIGFSSPIILENSKLLYKIRKEATMDLCLATPFKKIKYIFDSLKNHGRVLKSWLGITMGTKDNHIIVTSVHTDSPAKKSGIVPGDKIIRYNRKHITSKLELTNKINTTFPGNKILIEVDRNNNTKKFSVKLEELNTSFWFKSVDLRTLPSKNSSIEFFDKLPAPITLKSFKSATWAQNNVFTLLNNFEKISLKLGNIKSLKNKMKSSNVSSQSLKIVINEITKLEKERKKHYKILQDFLKKKNQELINQIIQTKNAFQDIMKTPPKISVIKKQQD